MATITNPTFGKYKGKIGKFILKIRGDKMFISAAPSNRRKANDPASIARKNKFGMATKFASCLAKNQYMKQIWLKSEPIKKSSANNLITKTVYPYIVNNDISQNPRIFPSFPGLQFEMNNISVKPDSISVEINPVPESQQEGYPVLNQASHLQMAVFLKLSDPLDPCLEAYKLFNFSSANVPFNPNNQTKFSIPFIDAAQMYISEYFSLRLFIVFFALDSMSNLLGFSEPFDITHKNNM
ncbi:MAG: hypothetical protein NTY74_02765 [Ignavibacteriae bacterium]|nr:hypothetical protein [Ignavibacteriota bacterium]